MREWQVGDPIGDGNDIGVPDIKYMCYLKDKDSRSSHEHTDSISYREAKTDYDYHMKNARNFKKENRYEDAINCYYAALIYNYKDDDALSEMSECYLKLNNKKRASRCYYDLGFKYQDTDKEKSVFYYKKALDIIPDDNSALQQLGYTLKDMGRYTEAIKYFKRIYDGGSLFDCTWHIANCYMELKKYSLAIPYLDKCIESSPLSDDWAEQKFTCLLATDEKAAIDYYLSYANSLKDKGHLFIALKCLDRLLKVKPKNKEALSQKHQYLKNKRTQSLYNILNALEHTKYYAACATDEELITFMEDISNRSGETIDDIFRFYQFRKTEDYDFQNIFKIKVSEKGLEKLLELYDKTPNGNNHELSSTESGTTIIDIDED